MFTRSELPTPRVPINIDEKYMLKVPGRIRSPEKTLQFEDLFPRRNPFQLHSQLNQIQNNVLNPGLERLTSLRQGILHKYGTDEAEGWIYPMLGTKVWRLIVICILYRAAIRIRNTFFLKNVGEYVLQTEVLLIDQDRRWLTRLDTHQHTFGSVYFQHSIPSLNDMMYTKVYNWSALNCPKIMKDSISAEQFWRRNTVSIALRTYHVLGREERCGLTT